MTPERNPWTVLTALLVGYFMVVLDMTIVAVANRSIMAGLDADVSQVVWASSAYLLTFAALLLVAGRLGDRFGPKNVYLAGLAVFTAASLWCGWSPTIGSLIAARAVQGVGAALLTPQTMAVITRIFPSSRRAAAMSLWGGVAGLANLVGPLLGGVLVDGLGWGWIFFVNVPVGVVGFILAARLVPVLPGHGHGFDVPGVMLSGIGMFLLVVGIQEGGGRHWDVWTWAVIGAGAALLVVFVVHQSRTTGEPLLPLGLFRDRNFALASVAVAAVGGAVAALMVPLYFYLEAVRGMPGAQAGVVVAPMAVVAIVCVPLVGRFADRLHPRVIPAAGFALFALTLLWFTMLMTPDAPVAVFLVGAALTGAANAFIWPALAATATHSLALHQAGAGSGAYNAIRQVGSVLGSAAISAILAHRIAAHGLEGAAAGLETAGTGEVGDATAGPASAKAAFSSALGESLYLPIALLLLGLVASVLFHRKGATALPEQTTTPAERRQTVL
ncbi:DHA2 family efflux MFS transporter permease subunit [Streptomyces sp. ISL-100]|uniref:DHA2 family efflux MFS transporter permease subunit n=1 Tax=Streptomyces sp. ISL-100 TaxID=2819173 RepID=UPI001BE534A0|nr:DHA2 family efflux MFS transporter permease subunit [Streptomyces sp. ISL-100]MBT2401569.1 DHA2 family efflux MFS transporter permease subunit [Streptomyces sp. ISL-100]